MASSPQKKHDKDIERFLAELSATKPCAATGPFTKQPGNRAARMVLLETESSLMIRRQEYDMESGTGRSFLMANYTLVANEHGRLLTTKAAWTAFAEHVASLIDCSVRWD